MSDNDKQIEGGDLEVEIEIYDQDAQMETVKQLFLCHPYSILYISFSPSIMCTEFKTDLCLASYVDVAN